MAAPEIPPKTHPLSGLIDNGSLVPETTAASTDTSDPPTATPQKNKIRPPIKPKPQGLHIHLRRRASTVSAITTSFEKKGIKLKPPIASRQTKPTTPPPPKPPRQTLSGEDSESEEGEGNTTDDGDEVKNDEPLTGPGPILVEEEYDLTPFQQPTPDHIPFQQPTPDHIPFQQPTPDHTPFQQPTPDHTPFQEPTPDHTPFQPTSGIGAVPASPHVPAVRTLSYPQPSTPFSKLQALEHIFTPRLSTARRGTIEGYHELQAKHLPLFKSMTLIELSKKYAKFFPIKIQITEGHYGMSSKYSISTDDRFNLHFKKRMKQATIQTYGEEYFVPLSSAIQFGLVYDPSDNLTVALEGHRFRRVADIIGTRPLPKIVRVTSSCSCSNDEFLEYNELLVVKKVKRNLFRGKPMLKVLSLLTMSKKLLPEEAIGDFTTKPLCLKIDLPLILEHIPRPFPCKAMMYLDKDADGIDEEELPPQMFTRPVMLKEVKKYKSLVATLEKSSQLIDIPLDGNIGCVKANIVPPTNPEDVHELFRNTKSFLKQFDMTQVDTYGNFNSETAYATQNTLYRMVRGSVKGLGIEVMTPEALRKIEMQAHKFDEAGTDDHDADSFISSSTCSEDRISEDNMSEDHIYAALQGPVESEEEYEEEYEILDPVRPVKISTVPDPLENQPLEFYRTTPLLSPRKPPITPRVRADTTQSGSGVIRFSRKDNYSTAAAAAAAASGALTKSSRSVSLVQLPTIVATGIAEQEENIEYLKSLSISEVSTCSIYSISLLL